MIEDSILNKIHKKNLNKEIMTTKELVNYGLNQEDISILIGSNIIKELEPGRYGLITFDDLYNYGIYLINKEKFSQAINILLECKKLNYNYPGIYEALLYIYIRKKHYKKAIDVLEKLKKYVPDNIYNAYLYLLNYNIEKDKEYKMDDLEIALKTLEDANNNESPVSQKLVINELIRQYKNKEIKFYNQILLLTKQEKHSQIINIITNRMSQIELNMYYKTILQLSKKIIRILEANEIPRLTNVPSKNILTAIYNNNIDKALEENRKYLEENNIDKNIDIQYILLMRLKKLIPLMLNKKQLSKIYQEFTYNKDIENILINFFYNNIDKAKELIKEYLTKINKLQYYHLILNLIYIDIEKKDKTYIKTSSILLELSNNEYEYNITFYLQEFYNSLKENKISTAKIYLNIIKKYSQESQIIINNLEENLINAENKYNIQRQQIKIYLLNILKEMKESNQQIFILEKTSYIDRKLYHKEIDEIEELTSFSIGEEPKKIVLRLLNTQIEDTPIVYSQTAENYKKAYSQRKYEECLKITTDLLKNRTYGGYHSEVYAYMGLSYYHIRNYQEALKYLIIAEELSKNSKNVKVYNFEQLIERINLIIKEIPKEKNDKDRKSYVQIQESDFYDLDNNFGITNLNEIYYYVEERKMSIESACQIYSLTNEQILLVKLIYARNFYSESIYSEGDKIILEVEKTKNKTEKVKKELMEIRKNRTNTRVRKKQIF